MNVSEFLRDNWTALSAAPWTFLTLVIIAFGTAYFVVRWRYETLIDTLRERIEALKERLHAKDDQLSDYRERLHLIPPTGTAYSRLSNQELSQRALSLVSSIRDFLSERGRLDRTNLFSGWRSRYEELSEEERQRAWEAETETLMQRSFETNAEYDNKFKVDTILLRDELLSRLPPESKNEREYRTYEHPTNPIGMGMVADDLERLAKSLPV